MATRFVNIDHDTPLLLPPDLRQWVPEGHLVHFIMDAVGQLDLSGVKVNVRGTGSEQYPPSMLMGLLIYSYATGVFSSRQIERQTHENVATRLLCADTHPDHDTLCQFRRNNQAVFARGFAQVLELAAGCGVLKVGGITVAIDGTKVLANASKHAAISYDRAGEQLRELDLEIELLLRKAEQADTVPLEDGLSIPEEIQRRQERKTKLMQARAEMEARALVRAQEEQREYEKKVADRQAKRDAGKKPRGKEPKPPGSSAGARDQYNFSDPESRIMPMAGQTHFEQAYNAQAAVEVESRLIVGRRVCVATNDKEQLKPTFEVIEPAAGPVSEALVDSGYVSEAAIGAMERDEHGMPTGLRVLAAIKREHHGRTVSDLEKKPDPPEPGVNASFSEMMIHRVSTKAGRARYRLRQQTVEPVFGIIKEAMGFRRFSVRGLAQVASEWTLVTLAYNLRRLHRLGANLASA